MKLQSAITAALDADWDQVVGNGGPPCFHLDGRRFCLRAQRWDGHFNISGSKSIHRFVSLADLMLKLTKEKNKP